VIIVPKYVSRVVFKGGILGGARQFWGNPYLNSTTVLYDIDDLKMYSSSRKELERIITVLCDVSGKAGLQFCIEKSNICIIECGKIVDSSVGTAFSGIEHIDPDRPCKYLGVLQTSGPHTEAVVDKVSNEYLSLTIVDDADIMKILSKLQKTILLVHAGS